MLCSKIGFVVDKVFYLRLGFFESYFVLVLNLIDDFVIVFFIFII